MLKCQRFGLPVICTFVSHDREFIWGDRGYSSVEKMNEILIKNINRFVAEDDELYILGDVMLGDNSIGLHYLRQINCKNIHIILGNHDTATREALYRAEPNVVEVTLAKKIKLNGYHFYLSHYPTLTANLDDNGELKKIVINLYGHTHQKTNFYEGCPYMYHVGVDSHSNCPVSIDDILNDIKREISCCTSYLN